MNFEIMKSVTKLKILNLFHIFEYVNSTLFKYPALPVHIFEHFELLTKAPSLYIVGAKSLFPPLFRIIRNA